ncbi:LuxR C-terminal-related transcriptional regulator [Frigoribacterium sp. PhB24]|uniref:helix-turn-helix transcriptional regulator n=1 Tax=Frigoribacterium sp. PhB24 TaxID=2485204 RepID=UPI000F47122E|nr:LuxR C-terminal-related transcriptional regulator [Frigoribacterium sp. PhB24]ROS50253.1 regulatory LuxR family protein [Frigoribacterium sp. PhB24]
MSDSGGGVRVRPILGGVPSRGPVAEGEAHLAEAVQPVLERPASADDVVLGGPGRATDRRGSAGAATGGETVTEHGGLPAPRPATIVRPGQPLGLRLDARHDEFSDLLFSCSLEDVGPSGRSWLRARYAEIVPLVLAPALSAVEHGRPLPASCLDELRAVARRSAACPEADLAVVLRGALPALRAFSLVMHSASSGRAGTLVLAMARASQIAHELGACWAEEWARHRLPRPMTVTPENPGGANVSPPSPTTLGSDLSLDLVADAPDLDEVDRQMLTLTAYGLSNAEIARETAYSRQAVAWRLARLMRTWSAPNRTALVSVAFVTGVIRSRIVRRGRQWVGQEARAAPTRPAPPGRPAP